MKFLVYFALSYAVTVAYGIPYATEDETSIASPPPADDTTETSETEPQNVTSSVENENSTLIIKETTILPGYVNSTLNDTVANCLTQTNLTNEDIQNITFFSSKVEIPHEAQCQLNIMPKKGGRNEENEFILIATHVPFEQQEPMVNPQWFEVFRGSCGVIAVCFAACLVVTLYNVTAPSGGVDEKENMWLSTIMSSDMEEAGNATDALLKCKKLVSPDADDCVNIYAYSTCFNEEFIMKQKITPVDDNTQEPSQPYEDFSK